MWRSSSAWNNSNTSELYSQRNYEQIKFRGILIKLCSQSLSNSSKIKTGLFPRG